jgi:hypothetical protein
MESRASGQLSVPTPIDGPASRPLPLPAPRETPLPPELADDETRTRPVAPKATTGIRWGVALLFLVAIGGGGAGGAYLRLREEDNAAAKPAPPPRPAPADAGVARTNAVPDFVTIAIDTETGTKVLVNGEERGVAPVDLRVPGSTKPIMIELRREGYKPIVRELVPDRDRSIKEQLTP